MGNAFKKWQEEQRKKTQVSKDRPGAARYQTPQPQPMIPSRPSQDLKPETQGRFNSPYPMLNYHNKIRTANGLNPLVWDHHLATKAEEWGQYLKENERCRIRHPTNSKSEQDKYLPDRMGQNLYMGFRAPTNPDENWAKNAASGWFDECQFYDTKLMDSNGIPKNFTSPPEKQVGHFTQMMWKPTKKVGCAHIEFDQDCDKTAYGRVGEGTGKIIVCNYDVGNVSGQFEENVVYDKKLCPSDKWLE